jgi:hypothetical protein
VDGEDAIMDALRPFSIAPGEYFLPHSPSPEAMKSPEFAEKVKKGPVLFMTVLPTGMPSMVSNLVQWFVYSIVVGIFAGYLGTRTLDPAADLMAVLQIVGTAAFMGYGLALAQNSIWYKRAWSTTAKSMFDSLVYAVLTGLIFGWLW